MDFGVYSSYVINRGKIDVIKGKGEVRYYSLQQGHHIYSKMANISIDYNFQQQYLDFCKVYGCLGVNKMRVSPLEASFERTNDKKLFEEEKIMDAYNELYYLIKIVRLYQQRGSQQLEDEINGEMKKLQKGNIPLWEKLSNSKSMKAKHTNYLLYFLNKRLNNFSEFLNVDDNGDIVPYPYAPSLIGFAYWELKGIIYKNEGIYKCFNCGNYFSSSHHNPKFCGTFIHSHKACENAYNARKHRARKQYFNKGRSVEDIAQSTNRSVTEVREWIENYQPKIMTNKRK